MLICLSIEDVFENLKDDLGRVILNISSNFFYSERSSLLDAGFLEVSSLNFD